MGLLLLHQRDSYFCVFSLCFCYHRFVLVLCTFGLFAILPDRFTIVASVYYTHLNVCTILWMFVSLDHRVLNSVASHYFLATQKRLAANNRRSQYDRVRRLSLKVSMQTQRLQRLQTLLQFLVALPMRQLEDGYSYTDTTFIDVEG